jgi:hypothetical protein
LAYRFNVTGGTCKAVHLHSFKASQYDHKLDDCTKKKLSQRWHVFEDETKIQRDLYSSFLLMCANKTLDRPDKTLCDRYFNRFEENHHQCIVFIIQSHMDVKNSGIKLNKGSAA